jgi:hypothetical protein
VNSANPTGTSSGDTYTVTAPLDPILNGVTLAEGLTPALLNGGSRYWDLGATGSPLSGVTVIAHQTGNINNVAIAYAAPGALQPGGAAQYFMVGGNSGGGDENIFTADGEKVFLNAVTSLTVGFPQEQPFQVTITKNSVTPGTFDFSWASQPGKIYDLLTSTDLATPTAEWPVYNDGVTVYQAIPTAGETTTLTAVPSAGSRRFFAVREYDAPPPPPLLSVDFEEDNGGFSASSTLGSNWEWGVPDTDNGFGGVVTAGNSGTKCWGTVLGSFTTNGTGFEGFYVNQTTTVLRSPVINLTGVTGATFIFAEALDMSNSDTAQVFVIDDADDSVIGTALYTATDSNPSTIAWQAANGGTPIALPAEALGKQVYLEWRFIGISDAYAGWYIDDVVVSQAAP